MEKNAAVAFLWLAYKAAFVSRDVEMSVPGIPDEDDEFDAFRAVDPWTPQEGMRGLLCEGRHLPRVPFESNDRTGVRGLCACPGHLPVSEAS